MTDFLPRLLTSEKSYYWSLDPREANDSLGFYEEAAGSLLLIAMHLSDPMPWIAARNPLLFDARGPGKVDLETKRILGKRHRLGFGNETPLILLNPLPLILHKVEAQGLDFNLPIQCFPELKKQPGKVLPREIHANLVIESFQQTIRWSSRNMSELSQCLHAELLLLLKLSSWMSINRIQSLTSFHLHTSLKPCRMCAAFIDTARYKTQNFRVSYEMDDPGPLAQNTLLDRNGYN